MSESVPVRCPVCGREHHYAAPAYPCACGTAVAPALDADAPPSVLDHRAWDEEWITVTCRSCGSSAPWPRPELGCACGTVLRVPLATDPPATDRPEADRPEVDVPREVLGPVTIRTARDAVTAAVLYLRRLGHRDIRRADQRPPSGIGLAARGLVAQVDPTVRPASARDVECLWLTAMTESATCVHFSLAGYTPEAVARADGLLIPLFVLDLTGTPRPANPTADALHATRV
ncbi:hypothetical protein AB0F77_12620 [Streptomyces sp. NPDC026672]|uniref:hypothetical protein n=1 Tax=unclassified Streptomyces TaxID=2593676 RepID=UPI0033D5E801